MSSPEFGFTRREFLKKAGIITAVGAIGVVGAFPIVKNEVSKGKNGIVRVEEGNFIPLYESHDLGISPENFPPDIDALFKESGKKLIATQVLLESSPQALINSLNQGSRTNVNETISNLSKRNAPLIFGDMDTNRKFIIVGAAEILASGFAMIALIALKRSSSREVLHDTTRRKFLKLALGSVGLFGLSNIVPVFPLLLTRSIENPEWITRVSRIGGITTHMHPEQPEVFLRNAILAHKLLLTGKYLKEKLGRQPNIAFWVGANHSGIEDFLQAGQEFCRQVIALYPSFYLQNLIDINGGSEDFSSALLAYPQARGEDQYTFDLVKITDQELLKRLDS